jgi:tRNA A-37 threonylcarbamoyl transferase component Bud32
MDPAPEKTIFVSRSGVKSDLFQAGDMVGQYSVKKVLGAGGMGVVYLVEHTALKKNFALKALPAVLAQEKSFVERFKREATMLARLKHAHIVNVTDFGESQGKLYLVLEYVDGGSVEEWFEKNRKPGGGAPAADVQRLIGQVLDGLAHAHQAGIVHRDLKPANVLLEKTGEAKISDFGLARAVADEEYRRGGGTASPFQGDSVTTTGTMVGTIDFMSPEARNMRPSDLRSDIYALGVITYYMLTGRKPSGIAKPATQLVPGLDPRWDKFIGTCLAEDPAHRYQTAVAALEALRQIRAAGGSNRWVMPVVLAIMVAAGMGVWKWRSASMPPVPVAVTPDRAAQQTGSAKTESPAELPKPEAATQPGAPATRRFVLTGLPAGAVVTYHEHNHPAGVAGRVRLELPPGPQFVLVKAPGYLDWEGEIAADEKISEATVPLEQVPPHSVRFTGLPAQAQLKIGGKTVVADGSGAAVVELRSGSVTLTASAPKYQNLELAVDILPGTENYPLEMKKLPPPAEVLVKLSDGSELKFKWVPPGEFYLGSPPDEHGRQRTDLPRTKTDMPKGFYMAETEMTQRHHRALTGKNPSTSRALGDETRPVEQVAWRDLTGTGGVLDKTNDALRRLGMPYKADLPTEVEWEYACRAGTDTGFNDGSQLTNERDDPALNALAFYSRGSSRDAPSPVAKFKPNSWGLYDMLGNVGEWTYGVRGAHDPVMRGGNFKVGPVHCRSASRVELTQETRPSDTMGYRLVLRPTEE